MSGTEIPDFLPIWSCSVWGLPCPLHYCRGGALLPHLFTLTLALPPGRYVFCGTFRQPGLNPASRTLSGTLLCGVRTFLSPRPKTLEATVRSGCLREHYKRCWPHLLGVRLPAFGFREPFHRLELLQPMARVRLINLIAIVAPRFRGSRTPRAGSRPHEHR